MVDRSAATPGSQLFLPAQKEVIFPFYQTDRMGRTLALPLNQVRTSNQQDTFQAVTCPNAPTTLLQSAAQVLVQIPPSNVYLKHLRLEFTVTNNDAAQSAWLLPVPEWFQSVTIRMNSSTDIDLINTTTGLMLQNIVNLTEESLHSISNALNVDYQDPSQQGPMAELPVGTTRRYYLDLPSVWDQCDGQFWLGDMQGNLQIFLNSTGSGAFDDPVAPSTGTTNVTVSMVRALLTVVEPPAGAPSPPPVRDYQYCRQVATLGTMPLGPSSPYNLQMTANKGVVPFFFVTTRGPVPFATRSLNREWVDATDSIQVIDANGRQIVQQINEDYLSTYIASDNWPSDILSTIPGAISYSLCASPALALGKGIVNGGVQFTGGEFYQFRTESTLVAG